MTAQRATSWGLLALAGVLVLSLAVAVAQTTWHALGYFSGGDPGEIIRPSSAAAKPVDIAPIVALAPFGIPAAVESGPIEASTSSLVLRGVVLARPQEKSSALVSDAGGEIASFSVGEKLPGGAVLDEVAADHVILIVSGRRERLGFPDVAASAGVAAIRASIPGVAGSSAASATAPSTQEVIETYRRKIADNPQTVIDDLGVSATAEGYRVGQNLASGMRRAGLQPGDLVVRVNGVPVGDIEQDRQTFEDVTASGRARVEVIRDSRLLILSFPLR